MDQCPKCGSNVWDNREENAQRVAQGAKPRPEFKCADQACGWLKWPDSPDKKRVSDEFAQDMGYTSSGVDESGKTKFVKNGLSNGELREWKIQRQHSQHMALMHYANTGKQDYTKTDLKKLTDWFMKDLETTQTETNST